MALLDLVDQFIGNILQGNLLNNNDSYLKSIALPKTPSEAQNISLTREQIYSPSSPPVNIPQQQNIMPGLVNTNFKTPETLNISGQDDIKNNLYNNGPISFIQGGKYALTEGFIRTIKKF